MIVSSREGEMANSFNERFDSLIKAEERALENLREYFFREPKPYNGARYHLLGHNEPNRISCDDLCAVNLLGVSFSSHMIYELTDEGLQSTATRLLEDMPDEKDIWEVSDFSAADELCAILQDITGVGATIAGKILSRKRPRLIPIYDGVVDKLLGAPRGKYWASFHEALQDTRRIERLEGLRYRSGLDERVSLLRVFDVIAWMEGMRLKQP